ncbi:glycolate oxidase subunit GlcF [Thiohalobacter sp.]|uniref:glycolate oxidase subunit GlcF n=1 Tax=Thiohalobacter sp. TaxID=2025948 RepID=UPI00261D2EF6|nr:glycolate oxidase subunit GlcF [Thiohalobacter sp.]
MQTRISPRHRDTPEGRTADRILRSCVHCGFCTATCPTYQVLGDELDSPRGRIYLIKELLEDGPTGEHTRTHLDRCLLCRACETTCPSGVEYHRLLDIGRGLMEREHPRPPRQRLLRHALRLTLPYPDRFRLLLGLGRMLSPLLPARLRRKLPPRQSAPPAPAPAGTAGGRRMLVLEGCVQSAATPATNAAARRVLARLGIELVTVPGAGCCGALSHHLDAPDEARAFMRRNIDAWWPALEAGAEAIVVTASGCGSELKEYGELLADDPDYAERARRIAQATRDLAEVLAAEDLSALRLDIAEERIAVHVPCSLQHGQQLPDLLPALMQRLGFDLVPVEEGHLCCGSAGSYSILQPALSETLAARKIDALTAHGPDRIVTANIGCQLHLAAQGTVPVEHWIERVAECLEEG